MRIQFAYTLALCLAAASSAAAAAIERLSTRSPPNIPSFDEAVERLANLTVSVHRNEDTYNRRLFPHWHTVSRKCNTRYGKQ